MGALMISMPIDHPDIEEFINVKNDLNKVTKANISVRITDEFMDAVKNNRDYKASFTRKPTGEVIEKTINARHLFETIAKNNWNVAEPGMLFWDRIENWNLVSQDPSFKYTSVNPCAEEPLPSFGSCLLSSINLSEFVTDNKFDFTGFRRCVGLVVDAMNDVLDEGIPLHPLKEQRECARNWRQIGVGIFGLADMLIKLGLRFGDEDSCKLCDDIGKTLADEAIAESARLARVNGTYPNYHAEAVLSSPYLKENASAETYNLVKQYGLRNSQLLCTAPTGTLSTMLGISGGIEPIFANYYTRKTESLKGHDEYYKVYTPIVKDYMDKHNITDDKDLPEYFITAHELNYHQRVDMQAIWQKHIDASISSTCNLKHEATVEDVADLYMYAWKKGLKGITVYRDGCKREGILTDKETSHNEDTVSAIPRGVILKADDNVVGKKRTLLTGCVDGDTEYFNGHCWKKISEYTNGDLVLQYNQDGTATLVKPLNYIKRKSKGQYHIKTKYGLDMMLSPDHRNIVFDRYNNFSLDNYKIMTTQEIVDKNNKLKNGFYEAFKTDFVYDGKGIDLTDDQIRIAIAIFADGCYYSPTSYKCMLSVKKKRKRDRLIKLLNRAKIEYSETITPRKYYCIKFYPPIPYGMKAFPDEWYNCSQHQLQVIFDEVFYWDGYSKKKNQYSTVIRSNADFIQFVCTATGHKSSIHIDNRKDKYRNNESYRVDWTNRKYIGIQLTTGKKEIPFIMPKDGYDYCFSVPSTMLVLRRNDKIFITGNCGTLHVTAFFDPNSGDLLETYFSRGSTGGCANSYTGLSRMISLAARGGVDIYSIVDQLKSSGNCPSYAVRSATKRDTSKGSSCPVAIGNALLDMYKEMQDDLGIDEENEITPVKVSIDHVKTQQDAKRELLDDTCPVCGSKLTHQGGCDVCQNCGWSHCQ